MTETVKKYDDFIFNGYDANDRGFLCSICYGMVDPGFGIKLRNCPHMFCRDCIEYRIKASITKGATVTCPYFDHKTLCDKPLKESEVKGIPQPKHLSPYQVSWSYDSKLDEKSNSMKTKAKNPFAWTFLSKPSTPGETLNKIKKTEEPKPVSDAANNPVTFTQNFLDYVSKINESQTSTSTGHKFRCPLCFFDIENPNQIIKLKKCSHKICKTCMIARITSTIGKVTCPLFYEKLDCNAIVTENEIKMILPSMVYRKWLAKNNVTTSVSVVNQSSIHRKDYVLPFSKISSTNNTEPKPLKKQLTYIELLDYEKKGYLENLEPFECTICLVKYTKGEGCTLQDCLHTFCKECIASTIKYSEDPTVLCPYREGTTDCKSTLQDREIRALVSPLMYEKHLIKSLRIAECQINNSVHCKTPNCTGWLIIEEKAKQFRCEVCQKINCLSCEAIHQGMTCKAYQKQDAIQAKVSVKYLEDMLKLGKAMRCPQCKMIVIEKSGCDWMQCTMCKTEICWATKGPRWGKFGKGDTSGGCRCKVDGKKCHPSCGNCH